MSGLEIIEPDHLAEVFTYLDVDDPTVRPVGGGTALMLLMKARVFQPTRLIGLQKLRGQLAHIEWDGDWVRIGALTRLRDMEASASLGERFPVLRQALRTLSNVRVRNVATLGGHLAHGDPHMDLPPILLALDAEAQVTGPDGARWVPLDEFFMGYYATALAGNELVTEVRIPLARTSAHNAYSKCTALSADDWPAAGVAASLHLAHGALQEVHLAVSAATEKATRLKHVEALLNGQRPSAELFHAAAAAVAEAVEPVSDLRGSRAYKREMLRVFTARTLQLAVDSQPGTRGGQQ